LRRGASTPAESPSLRRAWGAARGWLLAVAVAGGVFVLADPHLYPDPLSHAAHLFQRRANEMRHQQETVPDRFVIEQPWQQPLYVLGQTFVGGAWAGSRGLPLEAALALVGGLGLVAGSWRGWRSSGRLPAEGLVLATTLAYFAGISALILLSWDRYLIPTLVLGLLISGLGAASVVGWLARSLRELKRQVGAGWGWGRLSVGGWSRRA
jgi:hypothetical protein